MQRDNKGRFIKGMIPHNKGKKGIQKAWNKGLKGFMAKEDNPSWKGDGAKQSAIHMWIKANYGKADKCENKEKQFLPFPCTLDNPKRYEWANKDHKYKRNIKDFMKLCTSCHRKYDIRFNNYKNYGCFRPTI